MCGLYPSAARRSLRPLPFPFAWLRGFRFRLFGFALFLAGFGAQFFVQLLTFFAAGFAVDEFFEFSFIAPAAVLLGEPRGDPPGRFSGCAGA